MNLFNQYGYIILTILLTLELIAFPLPGETIMTYCGYIVHQQKMSWILSIIMASLGGIIGITISHFIGKMLGRTFFEKYGHYIHLDTAKLNKISKWFERYGLWLIFVCYFIPGVRHIMGYFSGIVKVPFKKFMVSAYLGAFIWTGTFISLGKFLGKNWSLYHSLISKHLIFILLILLAIILISTMIYYFKYRLKKVQN